MRHKSNYSARYVDAIDNAPRSGLVFVDAKDDASPVELMLYDQIGVSFWDGSGVSSKDVISALAKANGKPVVARINSPGGDVFEGFAIYNALIGYKGGVTTVVDGLAASAASWIALAGSTMTMNAASMFMIHNSSTGTFGNASDFEAAAVVLNKLDGMFAGIYAAKTGKPVADIAAAMSAETFYTAAEAKAMGFADAVLEPPPKSDEPASKKKNEKPVDPIVASGPTAEEIRAARIRLADIY